jgi:hypothetical protein
MWWWRFRMAQVPSDDPHEPPSIVHKAETSGLLPPWMTMRLCDTFASTQHEFTLHADTHEMASQLNAVFAVAAVAASATAADGLGCHALPAAELRRMYDSPALNGQCVQHATCVQKRFSLLRTAV